MKKVITVKPPTRRELITLRVMIFFGLVSMWFFLRRMLEPEIKGHAALYYLLLTTFGFTCLKIVHEWIHYFFIKVPATPPKTKTYTVDFFTTFCPGEPYEMIEETLLALQAVTYPHQTYLCDEANDPYLKDFCKKLGVHHITRDNRLDAKAGNINNALRQSKGELCVVLDPDHVPFPEFLDPIVSHFDNPQIGFVQIVQAYKNHRESLIAKGAAQQTYQFYGPMMMTMNRYGTVQAIGANCTFRRAALESIGGHAAGLAEDMHTSMRLHAQGWKSVYVPAVLARGLVPATLSAYYQQQLKWSRGVFDLLITAYPALFRDFTWKQKLHYAAIPMHYASGLVYLINFLIPVIALFFDASPVYIRLAEFGLTVLPLLSAIVLVRHFVQWWVMEDDERGFHLVGGLLMIGSWWVFLTGLIYTILRKKVPYVPTPKESNRDDNWLLNVPNVIILLVSTAAIIYGLSTDWNPYNLAMAGFAGLNCFFMLFVIAASRQQHLQSWASRFLFLDRLFYQIGKLKGNFWILRRRFYAGVRSTSLVITTILVSILLFLNLEAENTETEEQTASTRRAISQYALEANGLTEAEAIMSSKRLPDRPGNTGIISISLPWGKADAFKQALPAIDSIYKAGHIPMLKWSTENSTIELPENDAYLAMVSERIRDLKKPVYLTFDPGIPGREWSWKYTCEYFRKKEIANVIWVWSFSKASRADFPGIEYIDWIAKTQTDTIPETTAYAHLPVIITSRPNEIGKNSSSLPGTFETPQPKVLTILAATQQEKAHISAPIFAGMKGVNYHKGQDWTNSLKVFTKEELLADFSEMKSMQINAIKIYEPGIYRRNILQAARDFSLDVHYGFWIPEHVNFVHDRRSLDKLKDDILKTMRQLADHKEIKSWNIGNPVVQKLALWHHKPALFYQQEAYLVWLKALISGMKAIDPERPVTVDIVADKDLTLLTKKIHSFIPAINAFGVVIDNRTFPGHIENQHTHPWFISYSNVQNYVKAPKNTPAFIANWQDGEWTNRAHFDGLKDYDRREKRELLWLKHIWDNTPPPPAALIAKVLKPAAGTFSGFGLVYNALFRQQNKWVLASAVNSGFQFEWKLVKMDRTGNALSVIDAGEGPRLELKIPKNAEMHVLYLYILRNNVVMQTIKSELNTPLPLTTDWLSGSKYSQ